MKVDQEHWLLHECMALRAQEAKRPPIEGTVRVRALKEISGGLNTEDLLALAAAISRVKSFSELANTIQAKARSAALGAVILIGTLVGQFSELPFPDAA